MTRVAASPTAGMHGTELRSQERRTSRHLAPRHPVFPPGGSVLHGTPQPLSLFTGTGNCWRPFTHPQRLPFLTGAIPGSTFPACHFVSRTTHSQPVRPAAPLPVPVRPVPAASLLRPVAGSLPRAARHSPGLRSPSGILRPSGSMHSTGSVTGQSALRKRPISSRSPLPFSFLISEPDHRSRPATPSPAGCSSNLSEPSPLCSGIRFRSITFPCRNQSFPQLCFRRDSIGCSRVRLNAL